MRRRVREAWSPAPAPREVKETGPQPRPPDAAIARKSLRPVSWIKMLFKTFLKSKDSEKTERPPPAPNSPPIPLSSRQQPRPHGSQIRFLSADHCVSLLQSPGWPLCQPAAKHSSLQSPGKLCSFIPCNCSWYKALVDEAYPDPFTPQLPGFFSPGVWPSPCPLPPTQHCSPQIGNLNVSYNFLASCPTGERDGWIGPAYILKNHGQVSVAAAPLQMWLKFPSSSAWSRTGWLAVFIITS